MRKLDGEIRTEADFMESLKERDVMSWLLDEAPEAEEAPDTAEESPEQPRDPATGKFLPKEPPAPEGEEVETPEAPAETETAEGEEASTEETQEPEELAFELEPELYEVLEKYDGDLNKALKALGDSQSMIGRQGNELGELRQQLSELAALVQQNQINPAMFQPYRNNIDENPQALVVEVLERSAAGMPFDQGTYEQAIAAWGEEDPFGAARLDAQVAFARQQAAAMASAHQEPAQEQTLEQAMSEVAQRHPDMEKYVPAIGEISKEFPTLRASMESGTPPQRAQAFEELLKIAKSRSTDTSREALRRVVLKTQEDVRKEKADAAVVSAKNTSAASATQESDLDLWHREFRRATGQPLD